MQFWWGGVFQGQSTPNPPTSAVCAYPCACSFGAGGAPEGMRVAMIRSH
jgi:hypothetical protein